MTTAQRTGAGAVRRSPQVETVPETATLIEACVLTRRHDFMGLDRFLRTQLEHASSVTVFVEHLLAPLQRRIGDLWARGEIETSHVVLASDLASACLRDAVPTRRADGALVGVACPPGEWHDLPARMIAAELRDYGWATDVLGPSVSVTAIEEYARRARPVALVLSCTMSTLLVSVADAIGAASRARIPVVVGGAAFGGSPRRGAALGAAEWCHDVRAADQVLRRWRRQSPSVLASGTSGGEAALTPQHRARIIDSALRYVFRGDVSQDATPDQVVLDVETLLALAEGSGITGDESVLVEGLRQHRWRATTYLASSPLTAVLDAVASSVDPGPLRSRLLSAKAAAELPVASGLPAQSSDPIGRTA
jgi:methanogenic corrinoid protein MtbC1